MASFLFKAFFFRGCGFYLSFGPLPKNRIGLYLLTESTRRRFLPQNWEKSFSLVTEDMDTLPNLFAGLKACFFPLHGAPPFPPYGGSFLFPCPDEIPPPFTHGNQGLLFLFPPITQTPQVALFFSNYSPLMAAGLPLPSHLFFFFAASCNLLPLLTCCVLLLLLFRFFSLWTGNKRFFPFPNLLFRRFAPAFPWTT